MAIALLLAACGGGKPALPAADVGQDVVVPLTDGGAASDTASADGLSSEGPTADVVATGALDAAAFACQPKYAGAIPGANVDLAKTPCVFSISKSSNGFTFPFQVVVDASELLQPAGNQGHCPPPGNQVFGGVPTLIRLDGNAAGEQQTWCLCDTGMCFGMGLEFEATKPGVHDAKFWWDGKNFHGPSDTMQVPGKPFPPGEYLFRVQTDGKRKKADGTVEQYAATASLKILLLP